MWSDNIYIAEGHNNTADLARFHLLDTDSCGNKLFPNTLYLMNDWRDSEERSLSASGRYKPVGRPNASVTLGLVTREEFNYLVVNFTDGNEDGLVTVRLRNKTLDEWHNYNATMVLPQERRFFLDQLTDFKLEFRYLEEL